MKYTQIKATNTTRSIGTMQLEYKGIGSRTAQLAPDRPLVAIPTQTKSQAFLYNAICTKETKTSLRKANDQAQRNQPLLKCREKTNRYILKCSRS